MIDSSDLTHGVIRVADVLCVDCGGEVFTYLVPDRVWYGLNFKKADYACLACFGKRLNARKPATTADEVANEIRRQRSRFGLVEANECRGEVVLLNPSGARRKKLFYYWKHGLIIASPATLGRGSVKLTSPDKQTAH